MRSKVDVLIKNGLIHDGTLSEPFVSDISISDDKIYQIAPSLTNNADMVIDARGLVVSPGFIDTHAHSDFTLMADPRAEGKISQGITTEINGNCGMSAAPLYGKVYEKREEDLRELGIRERWNTLTEYFEIMNKKGFAINFAMLAGHGNIRGSVVGYDDRSPTQAELSEMYGILANTLEQGAKGLSTGLIYPPGIYSNTEELIYLAKALQERGLIYASHMRSEGDLLDEAVAEVIKIGLDAGIKVHISHIKTAGQQNWSKADGTISSVKDAITSGVRLTCDRYPYIASSTDLDSILPAWTYAGGNAEEIRRLDEEEDRKKIRSELLKQSSSHCYWEGVIVSSVISEKNAWMEGKTIAEISLKLGMDEIDSVFKILVEEKLRVGAIFLSMNEDNLKKFISLPFCMIGSDSSARCSDGPTRQGVPHPRGFGTFPRFFGKYVRDEKMMSLSVAVHKATQLAAKTFGLKGRGRIAEGLFADIVIFDQEKIADRSGFADPFQTSVGIHFVLVNGTPAVWEGRITGEHRGKILK